MSAEFIYLLKINIALVIFYAFYRLFFYKDTFFNLRRCILLTFFGLAIFYPFMNLQDWLRKHDPIVEVIMIYSSFMPGTTVASATTESSVSWKEIVSFTLSGIYWVGVLALIVRFIIQFSSIMWLRIKSGKIMLKHMPVYKLNEPAGPFSFFRLIFIHTENHTEDELDEILTHELTHVRQWHSIDVMLSELFCIFCWFNPFVWLLKREVRHNLEYLADNRVLQSGYDSQSYQYHLLGLAHHKSGSSLYNNFNMLHLKNRILMMNKKRSNAISRTKYLLFLPLVMLLMVISNIDSVARITKDIASSVIYPEMETPTYMSGLVVDSYGAPLPGTTIILNDLNTENITHSGEKPNIKIPENLLNFSNPGMNVEEIRINEDAEPAVVDMATAEDVVFTVVEQMPEFPGGDKELMGYIARNIRYPVLAQENNIQGRVVCTFTISNTGQVVNPEVIRGIDKTLDEEAIRVIKTMPDWKPGKQRNKNVAVKYTLPVTFRLTTK